MDLMEIAGKMFMEKMTNKSQDQEQSLDMGAITGALSGLLPTKGGQPDLGSIVGGFMKSDSGGLGNMVKSWLGDGANDAISADQIKGALGQDKISEFAKRLGMNDDDAAGGLASMLPDLIDKNSKGGNLLGGAAGGILKSVFGKMLGGR